MTRPNYMRVAVLLVGLLAAGVVGSAPVAEDAVVPEWPQRLTEAMGAIVETTRDVNDAAGYGYDTDVCLLAGRITPGQSASFTRRFERGQAYAVIAAADRTAVDLDLSITDRDGKTVAVDEHPDATPRVPFRPDRSGVYRLTVTLRKAKDTNGAFCAVAILRKGGFDLDPADLDTAVKGLRHACEEVLRVPRLKVTLPPAIGEQWPVYGAVLEQTEEQTISPLRFGMGERLLLTIGDRNAEDVDVAVLDADGEMLLRDKSREPFAFLKFTEDQDRSRGVRFKNARSKRGKPSLILTAVLRLE